MLDVEFEDGTHQQVVTDRTWKTSKGPLVSADQLQGATWDSRREVPGWDAVDFALDAWKPVDVLVRPPAKFSAYPGEPVREMRVVPARAVTEPLPGVRVIDFGQNLVGWVRFSVSGRAGQKLVIRHGEMLNADGTVYTENLRSARATDVFHLKGGPETLEPMFTFHGFRYAEVTGLDAAPVPDAWSAVVIHNDLRETGSFSSSHELVNQVFANTMWGQRGNYVDVPTDCPQRDERMGWMGDAQVFARTASYNMDVTAFMTKWLADVRDAQLPDGAFSDITPRVPDAPLPGAPGWGDAGVIVPWTMYRHYGDLRALERQYEAMTRWVAWVDGGNPDHLWTTRVGNNYGDWLSPEGEGVKPLYATAYFAYSTHLVAEVARLLGKENDARRYTELRDRIREAFVKAYLSPDGTLKGDTQTAYLLALRFDVVPPEMRSKLAEKLYARIAARDGHLGTGFLGVNILLPTLTDLGRNDLAYQLVTKTHVPLVGLLHRQRRDDDLGAVEQLHEGEGVRRRRHELVQPLRLRVGGGVAVHDGARHRRAGARLLEDPHRPAAGCAVVVGARALRLAARPHRERLAYRGRAVHARRDGAAQHHGGGRRAGKECRRGDRGRPAGPAGQGAEAAA